MAEQTSTTSWGNYYYFHNDQNHTTCKCFNLKDKIENLIQRGYLCQNDDWQGLGQWGLGGQPGFGWFFFF